MSATRGRQAQKAATRAALRDAALRCFAEQGWAGTQVADVAARAGVAHGTFYVHFPNLEALADELLAEFNAGLVAHVSPALPSGVRAVAGRFLDYLSEHRAFAEAYAQRLGAQLTIEQLREGINPQARELFVSALTALSRERRAVLHRDEATLTAQALLAAWIRVGLLHVAGRAPRAQALRVLERLTVGALP